jgi:hypothetical protein
LDQLSANKAPKMFHEWFRFAAYTPAPCLMHITEALLEKRRERERKRDRKGIAENDT